jgi:hypothetical protein
MPAGNSFFNADAKMTCEEFAMASLDLDLAANSPLHQAACEHMRNCPHCAALQEHWQVLRADLRVLGQETSTEQSPARVEMRLRQEFRTKHKTMKTRAAAVAAAWALAAAAAFLVTVSWLHWRQEQTRVVSHQPAQSSAPNSPALPTTNTPGAEWGETVVATNDSSDFTLLPGSMPSPTGEATVVHVQMQRAALGALGLTVNEERAADVIQVDLLVGDDGLPQAVRLPQSSN